MIAPGLFYKWVPNFIRLPVLLLLYFVTLNFKGVFQGNTTDIYSDLGLYAETFTAAYNAIFIGMGLGLMVHMRLAARFPIKTLILYGLIVQLTMHAVCAASPYPSVIILACSLLGFGKAAAMKELYNYWLAIWAKDGDRRHVYPFVFTLGLAGTYLLYWGMARLAYLYNWQYSYVFIIASLATCILVAITVFEHHPLSRPLPLYQMDWLGVGLLACVLLLTNYIAVYGQVEDWLNSRRIRMTLVLLPAVVLGLLLREVTVRRPVLPLRLLRIPRYAPGLLLFLATGLYVPSAIQFLYSQQVLHFELTRTAELNLFMIPGVVIGAVWSWWWYRRRFTQFVLICGGMLACLAYNILFYRQLTSAEGFQDFWLPGIFKGLGISLLYISVGVWTTSCLPPEDATTGIGFLVIIRSFLARGIFSAAFTYWLYTGRIRHLSDLANQLDSQWRYRWHAPPASGGYYTFVLDQAYLAATKELTGVIILAGLALLVLVLVLAVISRKTTHA